MKYFVRSLKYFVRLLVICIVAMVLMSLFNMTPYSPVEMIFVLTHTTQGWVLIAAIFVLSAFYPRFGFITRKVEGRIDRNRNEIVEAFGEVGYKPIDDKDAQLTFRAISPLKRLLLLGEDTITVTQEHSRLRLDGPGKHVIRAEYQLKNTLTEK